MDPWLGHLRSLFDLPPSPEAWTKLEAWMVNMTPSTLDRLSPFLEHNLSHWADALRVPGEVARKQYHRSGDRRVLRQCRAMVTPLMTSKHWRLLEDPDLGPWHALTLHPHISERNLSRGLSVDPEPLAQLLTRPQHHGLRALTLEGWSVGSDVRRAGLRALGDTLNALPKLREFQLKGTTRPPLTPPLSCLDDLMVHMFDTAELEALTLERHALTAASAQHDVWSPQRWPRLRHLRLEGRIANRGVHPLLPQLRSLEVRRCQPAKEDAWTPLLEADAPMLEKLSLRDLSSDAILRPLYEAIEKWPALTSLHLTGYSPTAASVSLWETDVVGTLTSLELSADLDAEQGARLTRATHLRNLTLRGHHRFHPTPLSPQLFEAPWGHDLESLALSHCCISAESLQALAKFLNERPIHTLCLDSCDFDIASWSQFAQKLPESALRHLTLRDLKATRARLPSLLCSPQIRRLDTLEVFTESWEDVQALLTNPALEALDLLRVRCTTFARLLEPHRAWLKTSRREGRPRPRLMSVTLHER